jgi:DNA helicase IV
MPFYRARADDTCGLSRRRQIMVDRRKVIAVADDLFGGAGDEPSGTRLRGGDALLAELERARTGEMLDIVATIQAEQDEINWSPCRAARGRGRRPWDCTGLHTCSTTILPWPGPACW